MRLPTWAEPLLAEAGIGPVSGAERLGGGDVGEVFRIRGGGSDLVLKGLARGAPGAMFLREAAGLRALAAAGVRVPKVLASGPEGLLMTYLAPGASDPEALGRMVAHLHAHRPTPERYGWPTSTFLGPVELPRAEGSWPSVFREGRLGPLLRATWGALGDRGPRIEAWASTVELPQEGAALLHGDLWSGNALATVEGPALIDPGVYWGERAVDLSMMELFGGFGGRCRAAYEEALPVPAPVRAVIPGYQLIYVLVHVHLFGAGYLSAVDRCLEALHA